MYFVPQELMDESVFRKGETLLCFKEVKTTSFSITEILIIDLENRGCNCRVLKKQCITEICSFLNSGFNGYYYFFL